MRSLYFTQKLIDPFMGPHPCHVVQNPSAIHQPLEHVPINNLNLVGGFTPPAKYQSIGMIIPSILEKVKVMFRLLDLRTLNHRYEFLFLRFLISFNLSTNSTL